MEQDITLLECKNHLVYMLNRLFMPYIELCKDIDKFALWNLLGDIVSDW